MSGSQFVPGTVVGGYVIRERIGAGGMGEVFAAHDARLDRMVALKILPPQLTSDPLRVERFMTEARTASALNHPAVVSIYEIGKHVLGDQAGSVVHYMAMELIDGRTLGSWLEEDPPVADVLDQIARIARAVGKAHSCGVVHRDLKPDNIMITSDGESKLLDFGLAKLLEPATAGTGNVRGAPTLTRPSTLLGTIGYMSPEQVEGLPVDHRSDVFSLGCILYEAVRGAAPFTGATNAETLHSIVHRDPPPIELSDTRLNTMISRIIDRALQKERERRYDSALDLAFDIEEAARMSASSVHLRAIRSLVTSRRTTPRTAVTFALALAIIVFPATAVVDSVKERQIQTRLRAEREQATQLRLDLEKRERRIALQDLEIQRLDGLVERQEELRTDLEQSYRSILQDVASQTGTNRELRERLESAERDLDRFRQGNDAAMRQNRLSSVQKKLLEIAEARISGEEVTVTIPGIVFRTGETSVGPEAYPIVRAVASELASDPGMKVRVEGHADSKGDSEGNLVLSRKRAQMIAEMLRVAGIDSGRITTIGHGEMVPLFSNDTRRGRVLNRRVDLKISY